MADDRKAAYLERAAQLPSLAAEVSDQRIRGVFEIVALDYEHRARGELPLAESTDKPKR